MYEPGKRSSFWGEFWMFTRIVYGILLWPMLALLATLLAVLGTFVAFATHWALGLLALAGIAAVVAAFAWWEGHRFRPPPR